MYNCNSYCTYTHSFYSFIHLIACSVAATFRLNLSHLCSFFWLFLKVTKGSLLKFGKEWWQCAPSFSKTHSFWRHLRRFHMKLVVMRFWCTSEANWIECALDAHWSCSHGITSKQIQSEYWWVWVLYIAAKSYTALENGISAYQDELKGCSETCPASTAGWAAIVRQI